MYQQHFGLSEQPFSISPDPHFLYMSERHREALAHLVYGAGENGGFVMLTGQVGTGKTTLIRTLLQQSIEDVDFALCLYSGFSEVEFLSLILDELGVPYPANCESLKELVYTLNQHALKVHAAGRKIVIIIDEAQNLSRDLLEQIRLLTNLETDTQKLLRIILVGQEELQSLLADNSLRQLSQRITTRYHLTALNPSEVDEYIAYRLRIAGGSSTIIPTSVRRRVYQLTKGTPRLINVVCERALLGAYADNRERLTVRDVELAAERVLPTQPLAVKEQRVYSNRWHWMYFAGSLVATVALIAFMGTDMSKRVMSSLFKVEQASAAKIASASVKTPSTVQSEVEKREAQRRQALADLQVSQVSASVTPKTEVVTKAPIVATDANRKNAEAIVTHAEETLSKLYQSPTSRAILAQNLAQLWRKTSSLSLDEPFCEAMKKERLACVERQTNLRFVTKLNRPALLELINPDTDDAFWVLLTAIDKKVVKVSTLRNEFVVPFDSLAGDFTGKVLLLLKLPNTQFVTKPGEKSRQVTWLNERLQVYRGDPVESSGSGMVYGGKIQQEVKAFQGDYGLEPDGIVGDETLLYLYNLVGDADTPLLSEN